MSKIQQLAQSTAKLFKSRDAYTHLVKLFLLSLGRRLQRRYVLLLCCSKGSLLLELRCQLQNCCLCTSHTKRDVPDVASNEMDFVVTVRAAAPASLEPKPDVTSLRHLSHTRAEGTFPHRVLEIKTSTCLNTNSRHDCTACWKKSTCTVNRSSTCPPQHD